MHTSLMLITCSTDSRSLGLTIVIVQSSNRHHAFKPNLKFRILGRGVFTYANLHESRISFRCIQREEKSIK